MDQERIDPAELEYLAHVTQRAAAAEQTRRDYAAYLLTRYDLGPQDSIDRQGVIIRVTSDQST